MSRGGFESFTGRDPQPPASAGSVVEWIPGISSMWVQAGRPDTRGAPLCVVTQQVPDHPWQSKSVLSDRAVRYVTGVYENGSIRAAARAMGVAPSAVQRVIAAAERQLAVELFERSVTGVTPTAAGLLLVRHARERDDLNRVLDEELAALANLDHGRVALATGESFVRELWRSVVGPFLDEHPGIELRLFTAGSDGIVDHLVADEVDVAIALHPRVDPDVEVVASVPQPLRLICRPDHPFAARASVSPSELTRYPVALLPPQFGLRALFDQLARAHGLNAHPRLVTESQAAILEAVKSGAALSLLPPVTVAGEVESGHLVSVTVEDPQVSAVQARLLVRRGRRLTVAAQAFLGACRRGFFGSSTARPTPPR